MSESVKTASVIGWDIGGAHLKAVLVSGDGSVLAARQVYCPLWRGLHELERAIDIVLLAFNTARHMVTMTGELADIFQNRHVGVLQISQTLHQKLTAQNSHAEVNFFAGHHGMVSLDAVDLRSADIASMNWQASVQYVARHAQHAVFIDIGSTTTDIAIICGGKPRIRGLNDAERMRSDELVYTGVVRTPLMALAQKISFAGQLVNVAAEHFATAADVYTLTGDLAQMDNMAETADGAEKDLVASARRIARMIGWDAEDAPLASWRNLAYAFKHSQLKFIKEAVLTQLSLLEDRSDLCIVGAGAGEFMVRELAQQLGFTYQSVSDFIDTESDAIKHMAQVCFPAYAVASLGCDA